MSQKPVHRTRQDGFRLTDWGYEMGSVGLRVISYNLWWHKAYKEVERLAADEDVDLVCLQECYPSELKQRVGRLKLAGSERYMHRLPPVHRSKQNKVTGAALQGDVGMALYYNPKLLKLEDITSLPLVLPWAERNGGRIMQIAHFKAGARSLLVVNVHLSALLAPNRARRKQLQEILQQVEAYRATSPVIMMGDFNYPIAPKGLRKLMEAEGLVECGTHKSAPTHISRVVKGKFDRIFISSDLREKDYAILPFGVSDHAPVSATIEVMQ